MRTKRTIQCAGDEFVFRTHVFCLLSKYKIKEGNIKAVNDFQNGRPCFLIVWKLSMIQRSEDMFVESCVLSFRALICECSITLF